MPKTQEAVDRLRLLTSGIRDFAKDLHGKIKKPNNNDVFSPISIHVFLILVCQDPWFDIRDYINVYFHLDVKMAAKYYKEIFNILGKTSNISIANISFLKRHSVLQHAFKKMLKDNFISTINSLDPATSKEAVNIWVRDNTANKINGFTGLKDYFRFMFLNALYYKSTWSEPFAFESTPVIFHVNSHTLTTVSMMKKKGEFYYKNDIAIGAKVLKLPFANSDLSLVMILPKKGKNIIEFEKYFDDIAQYARDTNLQEVDVTIPKFKIDISMELFSLLKEMGMEIFGASLLGVIEKEDVGVSNIQHKVFLDVNEQGAEFAACTLSTLTRPSDEKPIPKQGLIIYEANISTEVSNRFAKTNITWRVNNSGKNAASADFKVVLSETAFITEFIMEIDGKSYKSYIKEKQEAKNIFNTAVAQGQSAGLVEAKTRDSKEFTVSVNLEPTSVAAFYLKYEEMLQRNRDQYELALGLCLGQIVDDLTVEVRINESRPLKFVNVPPLRSGTDIISSPYDHHLDPHADVKMVNPKTAMIKFHPNPEKQKKMAHYLGKKIGQGISGQFVVHYDVEREPCNGEILLQDGHFVHFFAPNDLDPLPKHVIFVLDTSGSMEGRKIQQLKDAMDNILDDLKKQDLISIIEFNSDVIVWDIEKKKVTVLHDKMIKNFKEPFTSLEQIVLANPQRVNESVIKNAKEVVKGFTVCGRTFMIGALETALYLVKAGQAMKEHKGEKLQPIIIFLTDGEPNVGVYSKELILETVTKLNTTDRVPVFTLSFGKYADKQFLRKLSLKNLGFSRHIYEAADASLQLQEFFKRISSPFLHDIKFKYDTRVEEVTQTWFPLYFGGTELVVAGRYSKPTLTGVIDCWGPRAMMSVKSVVQFPVGSLERQWAYLAVKQILDERESSTDPAELTNKAIYLSLKYSFVTDVTSLVVVKPNESETVHQEPVTNIATSVNKGSVQTFGSYSGQTFGAAPIKPFGCPGGQIFGDAPVTFGSPTSQTFGAAPLKPFGGPVGNIIGDAPVTFGSPASTRSVGKSNATVASHGKSQASLAFFQSSISSLPSLDNSPSSSALFESSGSCPSFKIDHPKLLALEQKDSFFSPKCRTDKSSTSGSNFHLFARKSSSSSDLDDKVGSKTQGTSVISTPSFAFGCPQSTVAPSTSTFTFGCAQTTTTSSIYFGNITPITETSNFSSIFGSPQTTTTPSFSFGYPQTTPTSSSSFGFGYPQTTTASSITFGLPQTATTTPSFSFGYPQSTAISSPSFGFRYPQTTTVSPFTFGSPQRSAREAEDKTSESDLTFQANSVQLGAKDARESSSSSHSFSLGSSGTSMDSTDETSNLGPRFAQRFSANHPFLFLLQLEKDDNIFILLQGRVCQPSY